jgi:hypothetical protein
MEYIALDAHKKYTLALVQRATTGEILQEVRLAHRRGTIREFLAHWEPGSPVAVETTGNWYWLVDEIEAAGMVPQLVHARKAKLKVRLYQRVRSRKGHQKAIGAVARHLAEATYWMLTKEVPYQEPQRHSDASTKA